ncbi:cbb3-type cytochrome oxidase subunit 3 [Novosphingobium rosa]|uniref:cbb3-type cytochrome oxidase subunit 3 n=1 Tax=Novosphingobium rosa TaxID=76978 RepID=UPI00082F71F8|nr:cbb3-type cytochrome c oxidase subunit 3 [Novosphingobium rosa]
MSGAELYALLRNFADGWGLALMMGVFLLLCAWPFLPGGRKNSEAAATMIFKDDDDA